MEDLFREIRAAIKADAWVLALFGTLAVPDICAALESSNGQTNGKKYRRWVRENLGDAYPELDPDELYRMRCSLLHQGQSSMASFKRVIFMRRTDGNIWHRNKVGDAFNLDLPIFCNDVMTAAEGWLEANKLRPDVVRNSVSLVRWHRGGLLPYVDGIDVLS